MNPADYILAFLSKGPATRMALVGVLLGRDYAYDLAQVEVGRALVALVKAGRVESISGSDAWRLTERACGAKDPKPGEDVTPKLGSPCLSEDGE